MLIVVLVVDFIDIGNGNRVDIEIDLDIRASRRLSDRIAILILEVEFVFRRKMLL